MILPNAIIAGINKAGTTSLFRYLGDHPDVCISRVKEVCFFSKLREPATASELKGYASFFSHCSPRAAVRLEASPTYLNGGRRSAQAIRAALPDVKLIVLLRDPVSRLISFYLRNQSRHSPLLASLSLRAFVELAITADQESETREQEEKRAVWERLRAGCYAPLLEEYLEVFPAHQLRVFFFEDLVTDARSVVRKVCEFLDIHDSFYDDYNFRIENKTRHYRIPWLHKWLFQVNRHLQPVLNRNPAMSRRVRDLYNMMNEKKTAPTTVDALATARLTEYYSTFNAELGRLLPKHYPDILLPDWVNNVCTD